MASTARTLAKLRRSSTSASTSSGTSAYFLISKPFTSAAVSAASSDPDLALSSSSGSNGKGSRWLLFLPGAITFGLGTWQIFRRQDKIKLLEYREKRLQMEPLQFCSSYPSSQELDSLEFRKVVCKGVFDDKKSIFVGPRSRSISGVTENGYYVITPLMPVENHPDSFPILVNRGWVPRSWKDKFLEATQDEKFPDAVPSPSQDDGTASWWRFWSKKPVVDEDHVPSVTPQEVVGVVRGSEKPSIFVPANDPESSQWFYVDVPAIARFCGLPENTIYIEDANENVNPSNPYPLPKDVNTLIRSSVMPQDHLNYTLTWYSLSAAVTFMAYKRLRPRKKQR
ncbi:Surfeit locus protein 1 [Stylosanthes scabra]|uniref:SURF1-like protein n=1 Tax=Stylosanthes scabra TaxID=79078 RepID=A0ABU6VV66_9FABA|nr:Surfeit locus protein 1 [Stylosanthes scabra]